MLKDDAQDSVHWNATECHPANICRANWNTTGKKLVETAPIWNATGETLIAAYTVIPLEEL